MDSTLASALFLAHVFYTIPETIQSVIAQGSHKLDDETWLSWVELEVFAEDDSLEEVALAACMSSCGTILYLFDVVEIDDDDTGITAEAGNIFALPIPGLQAAAA